MLRRVFGLLLVLSCSINASLAAKSASTEPHEIHISSKITSELQDTSLNDLHIDAAYSVSPEEYDLIKKLHTGKIDLSVLLDAQISYIKSISESLQSKKDLSLKLTFLPSQHFVICKIQGQKLPLTTEIIASTPDRAAQIVSLVENLAAFLNQEQSWSLKNTISGVVAFVGASWALLKIPALFTQKETPSQKAERQAKEEKARLARKQQQEQEKAERLAREQAQQEREAQERVAQEKARIAREHAQREAELTRIALEKKRAEEIRKKTETTHAEALRKKLEAEQLARDSEAKKLREAALKQKLERLESIRNKLQDAHKRSVLEKLKSFLKFHPKPWKRYNHTYEYIDEKPHYIYLMNAPFMEQGRFKSTCAYHAAAHLFRIRKHLKKRPDDEGVVQWLREMYFYTEKFIDDKVAEYNTQHNYASYSFDALPDRDADHFDIAKYLQHLIETEGEDLFDKTPLNTNVEHDDLMALASLIDLVPDGEGTPRKLADVYAKDKEAQSVLDRCFHILATASKPLFLEEEIHENHYGNVKKCKKSILNTYHLFTYLAGGGVIAFINYNNTGFQGGQHGYTSFLLREGEDFYMGAIDSYFPSFRQTVRKPFGDLHEPLLILLRNFDFFHSGAAWTLLEETKQAIALAEQTRMAQEHQLMEAEEAAQRALVRQEAATRRAEALSAIVPKLENIRRKALRREAFGILKSLEKKFCENEWIPIMFATKGNITTTGYPPVEFQGGRKTTCGYHASAHLFSLKKQLAKRKPSQSIYDCLFNSKLKFYTEKFIDYKVQELNEERPGALNPDAADDFDIKTYLEHLRSTEGGGLLTEEEPLNIGININEIHALARFVELVRKLTPSPKEHYLQLAEFYTLNTDGAQETLNLCFQVLDKKDHGVITSEEVCVTHNDKQETITVSRLNTYHFFKYLFEGNVLTFVHHNDAGFRGHHWYTPFLFGENGRFYMGALDSYPGSIQKTTKDRPFSAEHDAIVTLCNSFAFFTSEKAWELLAATRDHIEETKK